MIGGPSGNSICTVYGAAIPIYATCPGQASAVFRRSIITVARARKACGMHRTALKTVVLVLIAATGASVPSEAADTIDILKGQYTFNWLTEPSKTKCAEVTDELLATFKSDAYNCNLEVATNSASGEPLRTCAQKNGAAEYLIFASMKSCELERETQDSNAE
jgi:hypothetical protein